LGRIHQNEGKNEQGIKSYERAIQIADKTNRNDVKARAYQYLGNVFSGTSEYKTAIEYYQKARQVSPELEANELELEAYLRLGNNYLQAGRYQESIEYYNEAVKRSSQLGDKKSKINAYLGLGNSFNYNCDFESSRKYFLKALTVAQQINDEGLQKEAYTNLGYVYKKTCNFDAAVKSYLKVKEISHNLGEKEEANACFMLGGIFLEMKQHEKAIEFFEKAIIVNKKLENTEIQTKAIQELGTLYLTLAADFSKDCDYERAIDWYKKALALFGTEFRYHILQAKSLTGLAFAYFNLGATEKAIDFIQDAEKIVKKETDTGN
jgi:tetratricopeptide (TPR) repeat protein